MENIGFVAELSYIKGLAHTLLTTGGTQCKYSVSKQELRQALKV